MVVQIICNKNTVHQTHKFDPYLIVILSVCLLWRNMYCHTQTSLAKRKNMQVVSIYGQRVAKQKII